MSTEQNDQNDSFTGDMKSLNLDIPEYIGEFQSMNYTQLANAKQLVESCVDHLSTLLHDTYKFDMSSPLVIDGFPRSDIDVVTVRLIRSKIVRLRNDHAAILDQLQNQLTHQFRMGSKPLITGKGQTEKDEPLASRRINVHKEAFAFVKDVVKNGPADKAGLLIGDRIISFDGDIDSRNHNNLSALALRVKEKKDTQIVVDVLRDSNWKVLSLIPSDNWPGKGLLGCHIVPI